MTAIFTLKAAALRIVPLTETAKATQRFLPVAPAATLVSPTPIEPSTLSDSSALARLVSFSAAQ
ncbi:hypothetical protein NYA9BBAC_01406 [Salinibacterium sp. NYA9b]